MGYKGRWGNWFMKKTWSQKPCAGLPLIVMDSVMDPNRFSHNENTAKNFALRIALHKVKLLHQTYRKYWYLIYGRHRYSASLYAMHVQYTGLVIYMCCVMSRNDRRRGLSGVSSAWSRGQRITRTKWRSRRIVEVRGGASIWSTSFWDIA